MDIPLRKVTARIDLKGGNTFARAQPPSRPGSPTKKPPTSSLSPPLFRPKAKINSSATVRKLSSSSSLSTGRTNDATSPSISRPGSPFKSSRTLVNGSQPNNPPKARVTARPTSRHGTSQAQTSSASPESRQRALTTVSSKLKPPHPEDRPRSGSVVALHHALSTSDLKPPPSPTLSQPSPLFERSFAESDRSGSSPVLAPLKIKSKLTGLAKSSSTSAGDPPSRSLSPPWATTRPIHTRARAPSITSSFSLNDPLPSTSPSSSYYPITTAVPAANPHRFALPRRAPSPVRSYQPFAASNDAPTTKNGPRIPKVDPASIPLPPHSPPISALSLSSKSSVSRTSVSLNNEQAIQSAASHLKQLSTDLKSPPNVFIPPRNGNHSERDRSRSRERSPHNPLRESRRLESDVESEGSERQLRAEAKTNRKIADLEITNRSLLAINASLETTKNRQAKEIRDLRRKLRESRLILPPQTYKAVKATVSDDGGDDDEDEDDSEEAEEGTADDTFQRVRGLIDGLIESGKRALERQPEDFRESLAAKVLNADEIRFWRDSGQRAAMGEAHLDKQDADDETIHSRLSPAFVAMPDSDAYSLAGSERDLASDAASRASPLPPITITHSL
ncbi:hypothetical protein HYDPIDRAFT_38600 [Hydnomerulius pinastri MD-312]|nr:hypothetical protein HYDPIDRAFT_38600 [Hydnomerulius pinastri MD-312]